MGSVIFTDYSEGADFCSFHSNVYAVSVAITQIRTEGFVLPQAFYGV
jgi:hypothetical protein